MALNRVWTGFFLLAFATALGRSLWGDAGVLPAVLAAMFDAARSGFEISLGLAGIMVLWLGLMRVGEQAGVGIGQPAEQLDRHKDDEQHGHRGGDSHAQQR